MIDEHNRDLGAVLQEGHPYTLNLCDYADGRFMDFPYSGTCGYSREVIDRFGLVPAHLGSRGLEHHFGFRAAVLGPKRHLTRPMMSRRNHPKRRTHGESALDQTDDPMVVHERQIRVRLQVLVGCRDLVADTQGTPHDPAHQSIVQALSRQIAHEARRLLEFEAFRQRRARAADPTADEFKHSGLLYKPNAITLVRPIHEYQMNLIAAECKYLAVPFQLGATEPCGHRNDVYPGVVSAWSESEVLAFLATGMRDLQGHVSD